MTTKAKSGGGGITVKSMKLSLKRERWDIWYSKWVQGIAGQKIWHKVRTY